MAKGRVDAVVVGADRIAANGDVADKIGTYGLAVLARHHGIPFYVAAPASTVDAACATGADIPIEERDPAEVLPHPIEGVDVWNPAFDVTPADLVDPRDHRAGNVPAVGGGPPRAGGDAHVPVTSALSCPVFRAVRIKPPRFMQRFLRL